MCVLDQSCLQVSLNDLCLPALFLKSQNGYTRKKKVFAKIAKKNITKIQTNNYFVINYFEELLRYEVNLSVCFGHSGI